LRDVVPINESVETVELADQAVRHAEDGKEAMIELRRMLVRITVGLAVGLGVLGFAITALILNGFGSLTIALLSFFLLPLGLWIVASVLFSGLGPSSL
jgi:hypothetical protein